MKQLKSIETNNDKMSFKLVNEYPIQNTYKTYKYLEYTILNIVICI